jgi:hypothetical protein
MELPDLSRIVETHVPVSAGEFTGYLSQLRQDVLPHVRKLQADGHLRWFSFLIHPAGQLAGHDPADGGLVIHLRLEPATDLDVHEFIELLPKHFEKPRQVTLSEIPGLDRSILRDDDWAHAWKIHGEASEWVLCLLEGHEEEPSLQQVVQFLHFITNPLMLGHRCLCIPAGFLSF